MTSSQSCVSCPLPHPDTVLSIMSSYSYTLQSLHSSLMNHWSYCLESAPIWCLTLVCTESSAPNRLHSIVCSLPNRLLTASSLQRRLLITSSAVCTFHLLTASSAPKRLLISSAPKRLLISSAQCRLHQNKYFVSRMTNRKARY